jgi:hypothetical protein
MSGNFLTCASAPAAHICPEACAPSAWHVVASNRGSKGRTPPRLVAGMRSAGRVAPAPPIGGTDASSPKPPPANDAVPGSRRRLMPPICRDLMLISPASIRPKACAPGAWHMIASDRGSKGRTPLAGGAGVAAHPAARRADEPRVSNHRNGSSQGRHPRTRVAGAGRPCPPRRRSRSSSNMGQRPTRLVRCGMFSSLKVS